MPAELKFIVNGKDIDYLYIENIGKDGASKDNHLYKCYTKGCLPFLVSHNQKLGCWDLSLRVLEELKKRKEFKR